MSYSDEIYVGPFIKVFLPTIEKFEEKLSCPNSLCSKYGSNYLNSKFCPDCGLELKFIEFRTKTLFNMYQFLYSNFDIDTFFELDKSCCKFSGDNEGDFSIILPNKKEQGGIHIRNYDVYQIPKEDFEHCDWIKLVKTLDKEQLKYEKHFGIIKYYM